MFFLIRNSKEMFKYILLLTDISRTKHLKMNFAIKLNGQCFTTSISYNVSKYTLSSDVLEFTPGSIDG